MAEPAQGPTSSDTIQRVDLSGGPIAYRQEGNGPPLILVHGWGGSSRNWQSSLKRLSDIRSIYALDLPGYGDSAPLKDVPNWERLANLLIEFANALKIEQFDVNGHSFGAGIAAYVAARWPKRVNNLVLTCFSTYRNEVERRVVEQFLSQMGLSLAMWQPWMALWEPWMALWQPWMVWMGGVTSIYQSLAWRFFYRVPSDERVLREGLEDFLRMHGRTAVANAASASDPKLHAILSEIALPTLLVGARQDMIMPPSGVEVVAHLIRDCQLMWIDQCGHLPMIEQPDEYHKLLRSFFMNGQPPVSTEKQQ